MRRPGAILGTLALIVGGLSPGVIAAEGEMTTMGDEADIVENFATMTAGGPDLLATENAHLVRGPDGITISMRLPTPEPGSYTYPDTVPAERQAHPEAFTLWAFVFNNPELCVTSPEPPRCGPDDFNDQVRFGAYNVAGFSGSLSQHSMGDLVANEATDGMVVLSGSVMSGQAERDMGDTVTFPLENPAGAEVHAAIAPHGQLDVGALPDELYVPAGSPDCECWWVAIFLPPVHQEVDVVRVDGEPVEGTATLARKNGSISMTMKTTVSGQLFDLPDGTPLDADWEGGDATTSWFVVFNDPSGCTVPCGEDDVIAAFDGNPAEVGIHYAGGRVAGSSSYEADGSLRVGDMSGVVGGGEAPFVALTNPMGAEVHIVNRSHGPASALTISELDYALNSLDGGCETNTCGDAQAAIFEPPS